jgi:hypothetical protein
MSAPETTAVAAPAAEPLAASVAAPATETAKEETPVRVFGLSYNNDACFSSWYPLLRLLLSPLLQSR